MGRIRRERIVGRHGRGGYTLPIGTEGRSRFVLERRRRVGVVPRPGYQVTMPRFVRFVLAGERRGGQTGVRSTQGCERNGLSRSLAEAGHHDAGIEIAVRSLERRRRCRQIGCHGGSECEGQPGTIPEEVRHRPILLRRHGRRGGGRRPARLSGGVCPGRQGHTQAPLRRPPRRQVGAGVGLIPPTPSREKLRYRHPGERSAGTFEVERSHRRGEGEDVPDRGGTITDVRRGGAGWLRRR
mmetsp:Transcript_52005/g.156077  ORF Transcript_52005/g.156077 Transcript_52005/m.156077 type:complete len:240 (+) Transcript_52005:1626-2345(+)